MFHLSRRFWAAAALSCACLAVASSTPAWAGPDSSGQNAPFKAPPAAALRDVSGIEVLDSSSVLAVSDTKKKSRKPRLTAVTFSEDKCRVQPLEVEGWSSPDARSSDLEAVCAAPGRPGYFYAAESGYYRGQGGRIYLLRVVRDELTGEYRAIEEDVFEPLPAPESAYSTPDEAQIEGMEACTGARGETVLLLGQRGSAVNPAHLIVGTLADGTFKPEHTYEIDLHDHLKDCRSISDIHLRPRGGQYEVLVSAAADNSDLGPFWSGVYSVGTLDPRTHAFTPREADQLFRVDGIKIEALSAAPEVLAPAALIFGSDDETFGGIIRPLD